MARPRSTDDDTRQRAVEMYRTHLAEHGGSKIAARRHVGAAMGIHHETVKRWIERPGRFVIADQP